MLRNIVFSCVCVSLLSSSIVNRYATELLPIISQQHCYRRLLNRLTIRHYLTTLFNTITQQMSRDELLNIVIIHHYVNAVINHMFSYGDHRDDVKNNVFS